MSSRHTYLDGNRLLLSCYWGLVTREDIEAVRGLRASEPALGDVEVHVVDATAIDTLRLKAADASEIASGMLLGVAGAGLVPTAVIARRDEVFGLGRMIEIHLDTQSFGVPYGVFRSWREAAEWLGRDLKEAEREARTLRETGSDSFPG